MVEAFEDKIKAIVEFKKIVKNHLEKEEERKSGIKVKEIEASVRAVIENMEGKDKSTTQLVKPRFPPIWSGQKFDRWKKEIERWSINNKSSDEDKYVDLLESLKRNDTIKEYVNRTLIEKVGENRNVKKVWEVMTEKHSRTKERRC